MARKLSEEAREDLLERGYSRRQLAGIAAVFGLGGGLAAVAGRPAWAAAPVGGPGAIEFPGPIPDGIIRLGMNECWTGPMPTGAEAAANIIAASNRYFPHHERNDFLEWAAKLNGVPADHILPWPGSSDPLCRTVVSFCSPERALVIADPTFELAGSTGEWLGARVKKVPLTPDYAHDVKAMVAADPKPGLFYVCSPNNPTGTVTPLADIEWLVANKPEGSIVLVDEAYIHFADPATRTSAAPMVAAGKDVVVLRTFSKIFGMAGMRMGYCMARPDILEKLMRYDGAMQSGALPGPSLACATASLTAVGHILERKLQMEAARACGVEHAQKRGFKVLPTRANMFMIDWKTRPARDVQRAFREQGIAIGRSWPVWPTMSRITVGSMAEMEAFCRAFDKVTA
jgi:histidinol-phosphate aminotransferase